MSEHEVFRSLQDVGAILKGHFVGTSGKHLDTYVNKDAIYPHVSLVSFLCAEIMNRFTKDCGAAGVGVDYEIVVGPEKGGIILAQWTAYNSAHWRAQGSEILAVYAEKDGDGFVFRRGYDKLIAGRRVLVVEDVLTTGGSVGKVVNAVRKLDGNIIGVGAICNRGGVTAKDIGGVPKLEALLNLNLASWDEASCPMCAAGIPINTDVGKGREFLARKQGA